MAHHLYDDVLRAVSDFVPATPAGDEARHRTLRLLDHGPITLHRSYLTGHVTASGVIVSSDHRRVLLCLHGRLNKWVQVGGHCEATDRTVAQAALREATEESGIDGLVIDPHPIDIDIHAVTCSAGPTHHYDVRFAIIAPPDAVERVSAESKALAWFAPDSLPTPLASATGSVVRAAMRRLINARG